MNPPRDSNNGDKDRWDINEWDLHSVEGPDDFDEWSEGDEENSDPHLELVESYDDESLGHRSTLVRRTIRFTAILVLIFFGAVFVLPSTIDAVRAIVKHPGTPDYYDLIYAGDITLRYERREIRYSIVPPGNYSMDSITPYMDPLLRAMESWSDVLGDRIYFVPARSSGMDDLLVHFVTELPSAGLATVRPGTRYRPEIYLRINLQSPLPRSAILETVACHELGHILGIWGHSDYEGDCMYPIAVRRTPSARDIKTMRMIYDLEGATQ